ncbi:hypothetical protein CmeUKMEL1_02360 [Cryptosporidium meleagridis]|uniref:Integral membrane protein n=1 Tax=Cryptosporidium meleagridis TaxID=93969 RepID=A0A2P4YX86_9CRYT|nr:hypothetical protein CmeUKMEL1_02360 [Cryptosporidium meleagridis]
MIFSILFFSFLILASNVHCSSFRSFSENDHLSKYEENNKTNSLITLSANHSDIIDSTLDSPVNRLMDDILIQERPVLLNTIPHTALSHNLFVNSSGLFTNITVVLTSTVPIAVVSPDNDSIHRILSGSEANKTLGNIKMDLEKISENISKSMDEIPKEIINIVERNKEYFEKLSSLLAEVANLGDHSGSNTAVLEPAQNE